MAGVSEVVITPKILFPAGCCSHLARQAGRGAAALPPVLHFGFLIIIRRLMRGTKTERPIEEGRTAVYSCLWLHLHVPEPPGAS